MGRNPVRLESVMEDRWLSVDEIAAYLGIKRDTVYKWISEKEMPAHRMGRLWKFRKDEMDEWVTSGGAGEKDDEDQCTLRNRSR
jgi:excisionase family DNA binding protein